MIVLIPERTDGTPAVAVRSMASPMIVSGDSPDILSLWPDTRDRSPRTERLIVQFTDQVVVEADFDEDRSIAELATRQRAFRNLVRRRGPIIDVDLPSDAV